ncbi:MAG: RHS repeat-associated core domain-containing protein, partial [Pirellulaceae bacterium]
WVTPVYDRAGNMTTIPKPADPTASFAGTYDAWNRLVKIEEGANNVAQYEYDGTKRRTVKRTYSGGVLDETRYMYYTEPSKWQVVEERVDSGTDAERQFVWGMRYVDDIVERDRDATGDGTLDERLYGMQDGNWNVTTLADTGGNAVERYLYDPYGVLTVLDGSFGSRSSSSYDNSYTFTGRRLDAETGLYYYRNRHYSAELGWFVSRDPIGFEGSKSSIYATAISGPVLRGAPTRHFSIIPYNDDGAIVKNGLPAFCVRYDGCRMRVIVCFGWVICSVPGGSFERFELHTRMIPIINQCCWDWCDIGDRSMLMESCMETELRKFFPKVSCSSWPPNFS